MGRFGSIWFMSRMFGGLEFDYVYFFNKSSSYNFLVQILCV